MTAPVSATGDADAARRGFAAALAGYFLWGLSIVFYKWLSHVPADEVIAHRIVWTVAFVGVFLVLKARLAEVAATFRDRRVLIRLCLTSVILSMNWLVFVWAIANNEVLAISFGYFINPLVSVLFGVVLLGERLVRLQAIAVGLAAVAVAIQATMLAGFPWISLFLACTFATYGYIRKLTPVGASPGLFVETLLIVPFGIAYIWFLEAGGNGHFALNMDTAILLVLTGIMTSLPLILFAYGARRLPLTMIGLLQYMAPSLQFLLAVFAYDEPLSSVRLASFVLIWFALVIFSIASWRQRRPIGSVKVV